MSGGAVRRSVFGWERWRAQYATQVEWTIDPVAGDDSAAGRSGSPLKTFRELDRRLTRQRLPAALVTISILSDLVADDVMSITDWDIPAGGCVRVKGTPTSVDTGTITANTAKNSGTNVAWSITDSSKSAAYWASHIAKRLRISSGARVGTTMWPGKNLGASDCRVSPPYLAAFAYPAVPSINTPGAIQTPVNTDPWVLESLPTVPMFQCRIWSSPDFADGNTGARLIFEDLKFAEAGNFPVASFGSLAPITFLNCDVGSTIPVQGGVTFIGCRHTFFQPGAGATAFVLGCLLHNTAFQGSAIVDPGAYLSISNSLLQAFNVSSVAPGGYLEIRSGGGVGIFDATGSGITVSGAARCNGALYGSGNSTFGITAQSGGMVKYNTKPTITGTTADTKIGGVNTAYAAVPAITAANGAGIVSLV